MWTMIPEVFPFFKRGRSQSDDGLENPAPAPPRQRSKSRKMTRTVPTLHVSMDKVAYRPGDVVVATIDICNDVRAASKGGIAELRSIEDVLIEDLLVEVKGIERIDPQWLVTPRTISGSKHRRGERNILESSSTSLVSNVLIGLGESRTYMVRTMLPKVLPPSYRGTAVSYVYYITVSVRWTFTVVENGHGPSPQLNTTPVKMRTPFQVWILPSNSGLTADELHSKDHYGFSGIVPPSSIKVDIQWREKNEYSYWAQATDVSDLQLDDDKISRRSESSSSSPVKGSLEQSFQRRLFVSSSVATRRGPLQENLASASLRKAFSHSALAAALISDKQVTQDAILSRSFDKRIGLWDATPEGLGSFHAVAKGSNGQLASFEYGNEHGYSGARGEEEKIISPPSSPSMKYMHGKTYNIRINDQILVQFGPRNPESNYYFGDTVSGTLSFLHEEGARRCLEVSAVLETREILNPSYVHPSRKNSSMISKVQSEYLETVCDMLNSHFIFSIPLYGPPSFSTPLISVQWILRFEFVASLPNVDWSKYGHPLMIEGREKGEWSLPIVVHAPLPLRVKRERSPSPKDRRLPGRSRSLSSSRGGSPSKVTERASSFSNF